MSFPAGSAVVPLESAPVEGGYPMAGARGAGLRSALGILRFHLRAARIRRSLCAGKTGPRKDGQRPRAQGRVRHRIQTDPRFAANPARAWSFSTTARPGARRTAWASIPSAVCCRSTGCRWSSLGCQTWPRTRALMRMAAHDFDCQFLRFALPWRELPPNTGDLRCISARLAANYTRSGTGTEDCLALMGILPILFLIASPSSVPFWFICRKAGFSPWLCLLYLIPSFGR